MCTYRLMMILIVVLLSTACVAQANSDGTYTIQGSETGRMAADTMNLEAHKATVRRYVEEHWHQGNKGVIEETFDPSYVFEGAPSTQIIVDAGLEGRELLVDGFRSAYPDIHFTLESMVAEGDKVVVHWIVEGTNSGVHPILGVSTGHKVKFPGVSILTFTNGKVSHELAIWDELDAHQQLGVIATKEKEGGATTAQKKEMIHRYIEELWHQGNEAVIAEVFSEDHVYLGPPSSQLELTGLAGRKQLYDGFHAAYPDLHFTIETIAVEGDTAMVNWIAEGTNTGVHPVLGVSTGKAINVSAISVFTFAEGKIVKEEAFWDDFDVYQNQLGVLPSGMKSNTD